MVTSAIRLTEQVKAGGCASKLSPAVLEQVLRQLPKQQDPHVLVGFETADDAGVYQIAPDLGIVQTVDFFTPIVDDPYTFGQIAACNALSDVYAMGGTPLSSLALVCFPEGGDLKILEQIMAGGLSKMTEAGCFVIGGHSIRDPEMKFGYAVTGRIDPERILRNAGAQNGDVILFTKAIGTGVISTALKRGIARPEWVQAASDSMTALNGPIVEAIRETSAQVHAATDVTGFGLAGHAREMALASRISLEIDTSRVPLLPGALECVRAGAVPGGLRAIREFAESCAEYRNPIAEDLKTLLFDPQTAGGLLLAIAPDDAARLTSAILGKGRIAEQIGRALPGPRPLIFL